MLPDYRADAARTVTERCRLMVNETCKNAVSPPGFHCSTISSVRTLYANNGYTP